MHEATFTLRQETPIIHFLHDQPGATLRATELKPKLDKWIIKRQSNPPQNWISKKENNHTSLDYKISIRPTGRQHNVELQIKEKYDPQSRKNKLETTAFPHLLGNMGGKEHREDLKNLVLFEGAEVIVRTWHSDLLEVLKTQLPALLVNDNFGNRSGKGFGSFVCTSVDGVSVSVRPALRYCFDWSTQEGNPFQQQKDIFSAINWFYKCLRSGINQVNRSGETEFYFKSLLFAFAEKKGERWDKYNIKNHFFEGGQLPENPVDYRDWLGLSTEEMWGRKYNNQKVNKSAEDSGIDRFSSPILFKPICVKGNRFKVWFGIPENFDKTEFQKARIKVEVKTGNKPALELQPSQSFDFPEFFHFAFVETDLDEHLDRFDRDGRNPSQHWIFKDFIQPIFASIQKNLQTI